jgi:hypothetical protein
MTYELPEKFTHAYDSGHGWLLVTPADLAAVDLPLTDISGYSYRKGDTLALEEDCDLDVFVRAYEAKTGAIPLIESREDTDFIRQWSSIRH